MLCNLLFHETWSQDTTCTKFFLQIRFFSFLMGEDVTDFREVRWMACNNNGYFAHIANLADVQEKVQVSSFCRLSRKSPCQG